MIGSESLTFDNPGTRTYILIASLLPAGERTYHNLVAFIKTPLLLTQPALFFVDSENSGYSPFL